MAPRKADAAPAPGELSAPTAAGAAKVATVAANGTPATPAAEPPPQWKVWVGRVAYLTTLRELGDHLAQATGTPPLQIELFSKREPGKQVQARVAVERQEDATAI